jgi:hypothetical protein
MNAPTCPAHKNELLWRGAASAAPRYEARYYCPQCSDEIAAGTLTHDARDERSISAINAYVTPATMEERWDRPLREHIAQQLAEHIGTNE